MKRIYYIYILFFLLVFTYVVNSDLKRDKTNWNRSFDNKDKNPMGLSLFYELLKTRGDSTISYYGSVYKLSDSAVKNSVIVCLENYPSWTHEDSIAVNKLIQKGNDFIVINHYIGKAFENFRVRPRHHYEFNDDSLLTKITITIQPTYQYGLSRSYYYPAYCDHISYDGFDTSLAKIFLTDPMREKFYGLRFDFPNGSRAYFISLTDIFCNYFISRHPNRYLVYSLLDYMIPTKKNIIWLDNTYEYKKKQSLLAFIFNNKSLYTAWLIFLFTMILYAFFDSRRNQMKIPIYHAPENDTLKFVDVVANTYFKSKYHHLIAAEKINFFSEYIRKHYHVDILNAGDDTLNYLAGISGNSFPTTKRLAKLCKDLISQNYVSEFELTELNKLIKLFQNKAKPKT
ncbi:MAG: hypothetical protein N3F09_09410 [Bacteroidia bacterium]|nr:hypothetical protein [Bacteroidia bacterium]